MNDDSVVHAPARLMDEPNELGSLLTQAESEFRGSLDEPQAWNRVKPSLDALPTKRRRRRPVFVLSAITVASAMALGWYAGVRYGQRTESDAAPRSGPAQPSISMALNTGASVLADGTRILVGPNTEGRYARASDGDRITLGAGQIDLMIPEPKGSKSFTLDCGQHEFRASAAHFIATHQTSCEKLHVLQGDVTIFKSRAKVAVVRAGGNWASEGCVGLVDSTK